MSNTNCFEHLSAHDGGSCEGFSIEAGDRVSERAPYRLRHGYAQLPCGWGRVNPRDEQNLWPEPRFGFWNAEKKDQLEDVMHRRVCDGSISLRAAQDAFRGNWTVAYQRYVTRAP